MLEHNPSVQQPLQSPKDDLTAPKRRNRRDLARMIEGRQRDRQRGLSERETARQLGVPRSSLRHWLGKQCGERLTQELVDFLRSEVGAQFLHVILRGMELVFGFKSACGTRRIGEFLVLTGLSEFVAASAGTMHASMNSMQDQIIAFGREQKQKLGADMMPRDICTVQDETFFPKTCLVAMEPVSNFILLEEYAEKRDAKTWNKHMDEALSELPVNVVQCTSDEGKGLLNHVRHGLGAHHSPDVFHVQYEVQRGMSAPLAAQVRQADLAAGKAEAVLQATEVEARQWSQGTHGPGRPPNFQSRIDEARQQHGKALQAAHQARENQEKSRSTIRAIGALYHPVDLTTGHLRTPEQIEKELTAHLLTAKNVALNAKLPQRSLESVDKAAKVTPAMVDTIRFFISRACHRVASLGLSEPHAETVMKWLIPQAYLRLAAKKAATAEQRAQIHAVVESLAQSQREEGVELPANKRDAIEDGVQDAVSMFQRASSCTEGRNGHLSQMHHDLRTIPPRRLAASTVIHNFATSNSEGTTPAQRFFGSPHPSLFTALLEKLSLPALPAARRAHCPEPIPDCLAA